VTQRLGDDVQLDDQVVAELFGLYLATLFLPFIGG
jgi:hypothetical protein